MWCGGRLTVKRVVVSLLMLATLLVYAAPGHAMLLAHQHSPAPHEHALIDTHDDGIASVADHEHEQASCKDLGQRLGGDACCNVAQCITMHGSLPAVSFDPFVPHTDTANHFAAFATPKGIGVAPALRPPL